MSSWGSSDGEKDDCIDDTSRQGFLFDQPIYRMADRSEGESEQEEFPSKTNESLYNEIKKLEKQKADLERRNSERQMLEKKLKDLQKNVTSLKTLSPSKRKSPTHRRTATVTSEADEQNTSNRMRTFQGVNAAVPGTSQAEGSEESSSASEEEDSNSNGKESSSATAVMTAEHKQQLLDHRSDLVENMLPEDIFSDLIANKVLTTSEVTRIKEKKAREDMNEELINNLIRKPDRAFQVLNKALRRTLQEHLAELLEDPPAPPKPRKKKKKKKRNPGEINMTVGVEAIQTADGKPPQCSCAEVEEQILVMANNAYRNIRRRDETPASFEQFRKEVSSTNEVIRDSLEIMNTLKVLCKHGRSVNDLSFGSVRFLLHCSTLFGCMDLWRKYVSGQLLCVLQRGLVTEKLKDRLGLSCIVLGVHVSEDDYRLCCQELGHMEVTCSRVKQPEAKYHTEISARQSHFRKCKLTNRPLQANREAFREIPCNIPTVTTRILVDGDVDPVKKPRMFQMEEESPQKSSHCDDWRSSKKSRNVTRKLRNTSYFSKTQTPHRQHVICSSGCIYQLRPRSTVTKYR